MVRWLVKEQNGCARQQALGHGHPRALPAREIADLLLKVGLRELKHRQKSVDRLTGRREGEAAGQRIHGVRDGVSVIEIIKHLIVGDNTNPTGPVHRPGIGALLPRQHLQKSGLAAAIGTEHHKAVAPANLKTEIAKQLLVAKSLTDRVDAAEHIRDMQRAVDLGDDLVDRSRGSRLFDRRQLLAKLVACGLGGLTPVGNPLRLKGEQFGLVHKLRLKILQAKLLLHDVLTKVARVFVQMKVLELHDASHDRIEKAAVVRDDDGRSAEVAKPGLQPFHTGDIEIIGGLVEQQHVGALQQEFGERRAVAPATG